MQEYIARFKRFIIQRRHNRIIRNMRMMGFFTMDAGTEQELYHFFFKRYEDGSVSCKTWDLLWLAYVM